MSPDGRRSPLLFAGMTGALPHYREPAEELLALCTERNIGVMAIQAAARRPWNSDGSEARWAIRR